MNGTILIGSTDECTCKDFRQIEGLIYKLIPDKNKFEFLYENIIGEIYRNRPMKESDCEYCKENRHLGLPPDSDSDSDSEDDKPLR